MRALLVLAALVLAGSYAAWITFRNDQIVSVDLVLTAFEAVPLWQALLASFVLGALLAGLGAGLSIVRLQLQLHRSRREVERLEQEIHGLRTLPLVEEPDRGSAAATRG
ncbi:MAG: lipopolysaccharide assembly protein LapA domain-containing protein [Myxococcota bacterium]